MSQKISTLNICIDKSNVTRQQISSVQVKKISFNLFSCFYYVLMCSDAERWKNLEGPVVKGEKNLTPLVGLTDLPNIWGASGHPAPLMNVDNLKFDFMKTLNPIVQRLRRWKWIFTLYNVRLFSDWIWCVVVFLRLILLWIDFLLH